jgi:linoleoyl-CoA desaturase
MAKVTFNNKNNAFYTLLKTRVDGYFSASKQSKTGDWRLFHKAIVLFASGIAIYFILLNMALPVGLACVLCAVLGLIMASIGFNVMHDACHGAFSPNEKLNNIIGYSLNILGGNSFLWKQKHNIIHHTYTNVDGIDDDIAKSPVIRQCYTQKWYPAHKVQHIYLPFIYAITSLAWVFIMDFQKYFSNKIYRTDRWEMGLKENIIFWATKVFFFAVYIIIPIAIVGFKAWLVGFLITHVAMGFMLAIVFQLAHVVEHAHFEEAYDDKHIDENWATFQVLTTANFARNNKLINWYVGGLNFQIEHHLFPRISHIHYPAISTIVKDTCAEFDIPYNDFPTFTSAVISHFKMMKAFGQNELEPVIA